MVIITVIRDIHITTVTERTIGIDTTSAALAVILTLIFSHLDSETAMAESIIVTQPVGNFAFVSEFFWDLNLCGKIISISIVINIPVNTNNSSFFLLIKT